MNSPVKYKFLSYFFLLLSVFVIFLFTKNIYSEVSQNKQEKQSILQKVEQKKSEYQALSKIQSDITAGKIKDINFDKYLVEFSEDELLNYFYSYANQNPTKIRIQSLSLQEWVLNEFGFKEGNIELNALFTTEKDMLDTMNVFLNSEKYNLYIHSFNYDFGNISGPFSVSLPLKILYK